VILGFAHAAIVVPDLSLATDFYCRMFGFTLHSRQDWADEPGIDKAIGLEASAARSVMLAGHNCYLELFEYSAPSPGESVQSGRGDGPLAHDSGIRHLAFLVRDCRREYARLVELGGKVLGEPIASETGKLVVYARDPFGNLIELCEPEESETLDRLRGVVESDRYEGEK